MTQEELDRQLARGILTEAEHAFYTEKLRLQEEA
jgi:hypothetical protein